MSVILFVELPTVQYRALAAIATRRGVNAHVLVEDLVARALAVVPNLESAADPRPAPVPKRAQRAAPEKPVPPRPVDWSSYGPLSPSGLPATQGRGGRVPRELIEARVELVVALDTDAWTPRAIADHIGLSAEHVRNIIRRHVVPQNEGQAS